MTGSPCVFINEHVGAFLWNEKLSYRLLHSIKSLGTIKDIWGYNNQNIF